MRNKEPVPNEKLRAARLTKCLTIAAAAALANVSIEAYSRWEYGTQEPHLSSLQLLCLGFGMTAEDLGFGHLVKPCEPRASIKGTTAIEQESSNIRATLQEALARQQLDSPRIAEVIPTMPEKDPGCLDFLPQTTKEPADGKERDLQGMMMASIYLGSQAWQHGQYEQAEAELTGAIQRAQDLGSLEQVPFCYGLLTMVLRSRGNYAHAERCLEECQQLAQQLEHERGISIVYAVGGLLAQEQGDYPRALDLGLCGMQLARQSNDPLLIYPALNFLGATYFEQGNDELAHQLYLEALEQVRIAGQLEGLANVLSHLSEQCYSYGDHLQADQYIQEGLLVTRQHEYREYLGVILLTSGLHALAQGKISQAETSLQEGLDLARQIGNPLLKGRLLIGWSILQRKLGRLDTAEQALREAITCTPRVVQAVQAIARYQLAYIEAARGKLQEARELATSSLTTLEALGHRDATQVRNALLGWSTS